MKTISRNLFFKENTRIVNPSERRKRSDCIRRWADRANEGIILKKVFTSLKKEKYSLHFLQKLFLLALRSGSSGRLCVFS